MNELGMVAEAEKKYGKGIFFEANGKRFFCRTREEFLDCINKDSGGIDLQTMLVIAGLPSKEQK